MGEIKNMGQSFAQGVTNVVGGLPAMGMGLLMNSWGNSQQKANEWWKMKEQQKFNQQQAIFNQNLAKEMWEYTGYKNQVRQMKEAGLNPALMYGQTGGGGTTSGGAAAGVQQGTSTATAMGLEAQRLMADIALAQSQAEKNSAEAEKIRGVDTSEAESRIKLNESVQNLNKANELLASAKKENTEQLTLNAKKELDTMVQNLRIVTNQADISEETKDAEIEKAWHSMRQTMFAGLQALTQAELNESTKKEVEERLLYIAYDAVSRRKSAEASIVGARAAERSSAAAEVTARATESSSDSYKAYVNNLADKWVKELKQTDRRLDQIDEKLLQDWIFGGISAAGEIAEIISMVVTRGGSSIMKNLGKGGSSSAGGKQTDQSRGVTYEEYRRILERARKGDKNAQQELGW